MTFDKFIDNLVRRHKENYARFEKVASHFGEINEETFYENVYGDICIEVNSPKYGQINIELATCQRSVMGFYRIELTPLDSVFIERVDEHEGYYFANEEGDIYVYDAHKGKLVPIGSEEMSRSSHSRLKRMWRKLYYSSLDESSYDREVYIPINYQQGCDTFVGVTISDDSARFHRKNNMDEPGFEKFSIATNDALLEKVKNIILNK